MAVTSNSAALFVLDCSHSMAQPRPFTQASRDSAITTQSPPFHLAKTYIKSKCIQRLLRDLKTTPISLLCYAHPKTKNILTQRQKDASISGQGEPYEKQEDLYRNMYEVFGMQFDMGLEWVDKVEAVQAGEGPDSSDQGGGGGFSADAHSALILALETLDAAPRIWTPSWKRDVYLLTDGESESDWERWEETRDRFEEKGVGLRVLGFNFDDEEETGYKEKDKSEIKRTNESHFHSITSYLSSHESPSFSSTQTLSSALLSLSSPHLKSVNSTKTTMSLSIGSKELHPESYVNMFVDVKKAVSVAPGMSMKRFSMRGFKRTEKTGREVERELEERRREGESSQSQAVLGVGSQSQRLKTTEEAPAPTPSIFATAASSSSNLAPTSTNTNPPDRRTYIMGDIGRTLPRTLLEEGLEPTSPSSPSSDNGNPATMLHTVTSDRIYRYRPLPSEYAAREAAREERRKAAGQAPPGSGSDDEDGEEEEEEEDIDQWEAVMPESLSSVYEYGGEFVQVEDMQEGVGELVGLRMGLQVGSFMKMKDVNFPHRLSDVYYILPVSSSSSSSLTFSAFINAMHERQSCAIVRFVGKGTMEKKSQKLRFPDPKMGIMWPVVEEETGVEYCLWVKMPYAEDLRQLDFPSLTTVTTTNGKILTEHPNLPTPKQQQAMDQFVEDMDLSEAGGKDDEGNPLPWPDLHDSYNPAHHNIRNTLVYRLSNAYGPLPPVPEELVKYLDPPREVVHKAGGSLKRVREEMGVRAVPPKPKRTAKKVDNFSGAQEAAREEMAKHAAAATVGGGGGAGDVEYDAIRDKFGLGAVSSGRGESLGLGLGGLGKGKEEEMELDDEVEEKEFGGVPMEVDEEEDDDDVKIEIKPSPSQSIIKPEPSQSQSQSQSKPQLNPNPPPLPDISLLTDSEPEPDTEDEDDGPPAPPALPSTTSAATTVVLDELNYLEHFERVRNEKGVQVAVRSMIELVGRLVERSFSSQSYGKAVKGLRRAREESRSSPASYNIPLTTLITSLRSNPHKLDFIPCIKEAGVGAIVGSKARGGMTEEEAEELLR